MENGNGKILVELIESMVPASNLDLSESAPNLKQPEMFLQEVSEEITQKMHNTEFVEPTVEYQLNIKGGQGGSKDGACVGCEPVNQMLDILAFEQWNTSISDCAGRLMPICGTPQVEWWIVVTFVTISIAVRWELWSKMEARFRFTKI